MRRKIRVRFRECRAGGESRETVVMVDGGQWDGQAEWSGEAFGAALRKLYGRRASWFRDSGLGREYGQIGEPVPQNPGAYSMLTDRVRVTMEPVGDRFQEHQRMAARSRSPRKAESSRSNGLRGGRKPLEWHTWTPGAEPHGLGDAVGLAIAEGHGHYRPRIHADDFDGLVEIDGATYRASCRWPDGAAVHQVVFSYAPMEPRP